MQEFFDTLTREVGQARSRRDALKVLGRGLVTMLLASVGGRTASAADIDPAACRDRCAKTCTTIGRRPRTNRPCLPACLCGAVHAEQLPAGQP